MWAGGKLAQPIRYHVCESLSVQRAGRGFCALERPFFVELIRRRASSANREVLAFGPAQSDALFDLPIEFLELLACDKLLERTDAVHVSERKTERVEEKRTISYGTENSSSLSTSVLRTGWPSAAFLLSTRMLNNCVSSASR